MADRAALMEQWFATAARDLHLTVCGEAVRGVGDRTLSGPAATPRGDAVWLRVLAVPEDLAHGPVWEGPVTSQEVTGVYRPRLMHCLTWAEHGHVVRAEVWKRIIEPACAAHETLTNDPRLPAGWWERLHASLDRLAEHPTQRMPRPPEQITVALRQAYGPDVPTRVERWVTQHGDLRWCNLTRTTPYLLDWELWGLAPAGTDAATLYCTSLLVPHVAAEVYRQFRHVLDSPDGRIAQLCVCIQLTRHPDCGPLREPLTRLAYRLLTYA
ncbi:aminoglycoside phosphotransferase [Thermomonospora cellulosilytica]|uniref:Aminoglycoside phosphotransferase n=1 Tax=Thermomonospora cellulosilytica TaxID=1411118 RepID=A0A7W3N1V3_9ACTN|nr:aminoglycoside phosphotransferase [Thermomonospora cellulosilytica]MBA9005932.1 hypothetical protein [Thermomonospora cellulosilytica]